MRNTRFARFALSLIIFTSLALALGDSRMVAQSVDPNAGGPQPRRGYFSDLPFEQIDMMNGDLHLTIPIFQLTGNAGLDLNVALTYNRNGAWRLSLGALPMSVANPDGPSEGSDVAIRTWDGSSLTACM
jgi:hypothetical protein